VFLVTFTYTAPTEEVDLTRPEHRAWLGELVARELVVVGGPYLDDSGGVMVTRHEFRAEVEADLAQDPYLAAGVVEHGVLEFLPRMLFPPISHLAPTT
jgi:uncharacterized protein YciI